MVEKVLVNDPILNQEKHDYPDEFYTLFESTDFEVSLGPGGNSFVAIAPGVEW